MSLGNLRAFPSLIMDTKTISYINTNTRIHDRNPSQFSLNGLLKSLINKAKLMQIVGDPCCRPTVAVIIALRMTLWITWYMANPSCLSILNRVVLGTRSYDWLKLGNITNEEKISDPHQAINTLEYIQCNYLGWLPACSIWFKPLDDAVV